METITTVNPIFINEVISPLIGGADIEEFIDLNNNYNSNIELEVKSLTRKYLLPEFKKQHFVLQLKAKQSLAYYLCYPEKLDFESIFNSLLLPIETTSNANLFFLWIWETLFPYDSIEQMRNENVIEDFHVNAPLKLLSNLGDFNSPLN